MSVFSSVSKYLEESAKTSLDGAEHIVQHTKEMIRKTASKVAAPDECSSCRTAVPYFDLSNFTNQNRCRMCCKCFCNSCIVKTTFEVPNYMIDVSFQSANKLINERQLLCKQSCLPLAIKVCMELICEEICPRFEGNLSAYLSAESSQAFFHPIPEISPEDSSYRRALRAAHIAGYVADMTGYSFTYKAIKYAYYSSELINILTEGGMMAVLAPLLEQLKLFGVTGPTALVRLYYLGCDHTLRVKTDRSPRHREYLPHCSGVLLPDCPLEVLQYVKRYISPAQWQYCSNLPPPHHDIEWGNWYLSQLIRRGGWTLILSINDSTVLPNGFKCPAFALVARCGPSDNAREGGGGRPVREAMLVVRGSNSTIDWSINLGEAMQEFSYTYLQPVGGRDSSAPEGEGEGAIVAYKTRTVSGSTHKGIYTAANCVLQCYNLQSYLLRLLEAGYLIKAVGHSLGAGVGAMVAAEMRNRLILRHCTASGSSAGRLVQLPALDVYGNQVMRDVPVDGTIVPASLKHLLSRISAVVFSCPACITPNLADALLEDRLLINTVYDRDVIPRFSFKTLEVLAGELKDPAFVAKADHWYQSDKNDFGEYAQSLGKAGDIVKASRGGDNRGVYSEDMPLSVIVDNGVGDEEVDVALIVPPKKPPRVIPSTGDKLPAVDSRVTADSASMGSTSTHSSSALSSTIDFAKGWLSSYSNSSSSSRTSNAADMDSTPQATTAPPPSLSAPSDATSTTTADNSQQQSAPLYEQPTVPKIETVTPGPVVHLFAELDGTSGAAVVTFRHESFRKMTIIPAHIAEDHFIPRTREALRSILLKKARDDNRDANHDKVAAAAIVDKYFDISDSSSIDRTYGSDQSNTSAGFTLQPISAADRCEGTTGRWEPCYVCGVDVTWPYVLHSDASRAMVAHNCKACGKVVCSVCSPSGDSLPGDGVNQSYPLPDLRIALPHLQLFTPQRVCLHCYFDA